MTKRLQSFSFFQLILLYCLGIAPTIDASAATVTISDTVFNQSDWSHNILYSNPIVSLGPITQQLSGGCGSDNGAYQQGRHTSIRPFAGLYDGHLFIGGGSYNPGTQGAIASMSLNYCEKNITGTPNFIQSGLLVAQGSRRFIYFVDSSGPYLNWTNLGATGITDVWNPAWQEIDTVNNLVINFTTPDFSVSGLPITFGYYTFNWSLKQGFALDNTWGIDSFNINIQTVDEPGHASLVTISLLAALITGRNRRSSRLRKNGEA